MEWDKHGTKERSQLAVGRMLTEALRPLRSQCKFPARSDTAWSEGSKAAHTEDKQEDQRRECRSWEKGKYEDGHGEPWTPWRCEKGKQKDIHGKPEDEPWTSWGCEKGKHEDSRGKPEDEPWPSWGCEKGKHEDSRGKPEDEPWTSWRCEKGKHEDRHGKPEDEPWTSWGCEKGKHEDSRGKPEDEPWTSWRCEKGKQKDSHGKPEDEPFSSWGWQRRNWEGARSRQAEQDCWDYWQETQPQQQRGELAKGSKENKPADSARSCRLLSQALLQVKGTPPVARCGGSASSGDESNITCEKGRSQPASDTSSPVLAPRSEPVAASQTSTPPLAPQGEPAVAKGMQEMPKAAREPRLLCPLDVKFSADYVSGSQPDGRHPGTLLDSAVRQVKANGSWDSIWYLGYEGPLRVQRVNGNIVAIDNWKLYVLQRAAAIRLPARSQCLAYFMDEGPSPQDLLMNCTVADTITVDSPSGVTENQPRQDVFWNWRAARPIVWNP
ncbi:unnamed protein product [Effrenium voratum]|nr:unnamed protein product [Effrenium voratum]